VNTTDPSLAPYSSPVTDDNRVGVYVAIGLLMILTFSMLTIAQARAQNNRRWWAWGLLGCVPVIGYGIWRLIGATDDGSPDEMLPR
jgi:hypothetical protein